MEVSSKVAGPVGGEQDGRRSPRQSRGFGFVELVEGDVRRRSRL
jgi:hypothetical protein